MKIKTDIKLIYVLKLTEYRSNAKGKNTLFLKTFYLPLVKNHFQNHFITDGVIIGEYTVHTKYVQSDL